MTDPRTIADRYLALWNEADPGARRELLAEEWAADATYTDPLASVAGPEAIDQLIGGIRARFPDYTFRLIGKPDGYGDQLRFSWSLGPDYMEAPIEGTDFVVVSGDRIQKVTGFLDKVPAMA